MKAVLLYIWQLPQNLLGLLLLFLVPGRFNETQGITFYHAPKMPGSISLGEYIFVKTFDLNLIRHEYGHSLQSRLLGWLYLPVIGVPSFLWAIAYGWVVAPTINGYYRFYTERWADSLGGVKRK